MKITKGKLKDYFSPQIGDKWDITLNQLRSDLKIDDGEQDHLLKLLDQLIREGWIIKTYCSEHQADEYDPGKKFGNYKSSD